MPIENQCANCNSFIQEKNLCMRNQTIIMWNGEICGVFQHRLQNESALKELPDMYTNPDYERNSIASNQKIRGWLKLFLILIIIGSVIGVITSLLASIDNFYNPDFGYSFAVAGYCVDVLLTIGLMVLAIYTFFSFHDFKPNAVGLAKAYVIIVFATNIVLLISGDYEDSGFGSFTHLIRSIIWAAVWLTFLFVSVQVNTLFPKKDRRFLTRDILLFAAIILPTVFYLSAAVILSLFSQ